MRIKDLLKIIAAIPAAIGIWVLTIAVFAFFVVTLLYGLVTLVIYTYLDFGPLMILIDLIAVVVVIKILRNGSVRKQLKDLKDQIWFGL